MAGVRVGVLGYGVIGKRVADAIRLQPDMALVGVAARSGSPSLNIAAVLGHRTFISGAESSRLPQDAAGSLDDLLADIDVLLDCTPSGAPAGYRGVYDAHPALAVIVQGGEKHSFGGVSFNAFANYRQAAGCKRVRVISCSSTGGTRLIWTLHQAFGLRQGFLSLWRRAADRGKTSKTPINALTPFLGQSHHAPDILTVLPQLDLYSMSADCPTTLAHVVTLQAELERSTTRDEVAAALERTPRILVGVGLSTTADLAEHFQDLGRRRGDHPEIYIWFEGLHVQGQSITVSLSVHMESITIPETIDCVRAIVGATTDPWISIRRTDEALGIAKETACYPPFDH